MKNTFKKFIAVVVLLGASSLLSAWGAVSVYAEETATAEASAGTNGPSTTAHQTSSDADHPPVRIDETGVHVGGANPVDINTPSSSRSHEERAVKQIAVILGILCTFGMPVAIIGLAGYFSHRRNKMAHDTLQAMIEKGMPITPELVAEIRNKGCGSSGNSASGRRSGRLLPGLILAGIGTALLMGGAKGESRGGWILLFMGAAFLIVWFVEQKNQNSGQPPR